MTHERKKQSFFNEMGTACHRVIDKTIRIPATLLAFNQKFNRLKNSIENVNKL